MIDYMISLAFLASVLSIGFISWQLAVNTDAMWDVKIKSLIESGGRRNYPGPPVRLRRGRGKGGRKC